MLRAAAKNHAAVTVMVDRGDYAPVLEEMQQNHGDVERRARAFASRSRPSSTPPPTTAPSPITWAHLRRGRGTRPISAHPQPAVPPGAGHALRREPAPAGRLLRRAASPAEACVATAAPAAGQGTVLQQHRRYRRGAGMRQILRRRAGLRHRQARQSLRRGPRRQRCWRPTSAPSRPTRPRPSAASLPSTARSTRPPPRPFSSASSWRSSSRPSVANEAPAGAGGQKERARAEPAAPWGETPHHGLDYKRVTGGLLVQDRDLGRCRRADLKVVTQRAPTAAGTAGPAVRLEGGQVRQVQRHRLCQGRHDHRRRRRPDEPGLQRADRRPSRPPTRAWKSRVP